jgi:hypothetical protein
MNKTGILIIIILGIILISTGQIMCEAKEGTIENNITSSTLMETCSINPFAISSRDHIDTKHQKTAYSLDDKTITWAASLRDGFTTSQDYLNDYRVYWYAPDGKLFFEENPSSMFMALMTLQSKMDIEPKKILDKQGLWKLEVIYKNQLLVDEKYFYLGNGEKYDIKEDEINKLNNIIVRPFKFTKDTEKAVVLAKERLQSFVANSKIDPEKSQKIIKAWFTTNSDDHLMFKDQISHISCDSKRINFNCEFVPFFSVGAPEIMVYWVGPDSQIFKEQKVFPLGDRFTSSLNSNEIDFNKRTGKWVVSVFVGEKKVSEKKFNLMSNEKIRELETIKQNESKKAVTIASGAALAQKKAECVEPKGITCKFGNLVALSSFRKVFVCVDIKNPTTDPFVDNEAFKRDIKKYICKKLEHIGFTVVENLNEADIELTCGTDAVKSIMFQLLASNYLDLTLCLSANSKFVLGLKKYRQDMNTPTGIPINAALDEYCAELKQSYDSGANVYPYVDAKRRAEIEKIVADKALFAWSPIFKKRGKIERIVDPSWGNVGVIAIPIWGIQEWFSGSSPAGAFAYNRSVPKSGDKFSDISEDETCIDGVTYIMSDNEKTAEGKEQFTKYYRDDFREAIFSSFIDALEPRKVNVLEFRYEDYYGTLLQKGLKDALSEIYAANPAVRRIFVVYYIPFSRWREEKTDGSYKYTWWENGLKFHYYITCFDMGEKIGKIKAVKDVFTATYPFYPRKNYGDLRDVLRERISREFVSQKQSAGLPELSRENMKKDYFRVCSEKEPIFRDKSEIGWLGYGKAVNVKQKGSDGMDLIEVLGYVQSKNVKDATPGKESLEKADLFSELPLTNRFDFGKILLDGDTQDNEYLGRRNGFVETLHKPILLMKSVINPDFYEVRFTCQIKSDKLAKDLGKFKDNGCIRGRMVLDGVPATEKEVALVSIHGTKNCKTNKMGEFVFEEIIPGGGYTIGVFVPDSDDKKIFEIGNESGGRKWTGPFSGRYRYVRKELLNKW